MYTTNMSYNMLIVLHAINENIAVSQYGWFVEYIFLYYLKDGHPNHMDGYPLLGWVSSGNGAYPSFFHSGFCDENCKNKGEFENGTTTINP